jgi:S-adenosylmethionine hydrolase
MALITLTTDFGTRDPYVAQMKGVLLARCPAARLVDLGHEIAAHDVMEGALFLTAAVPQFSPGAVHVAVVDPGVGGARRALAVALTVEATEPSDSPQLVVCPDNGLLTLLARRSRIIAVAEIEAPSDAEVAPTFHGRDLFAPAAAALASGARVEDIGPAADPASLVSLPVAQPTPLSGGCVRGEVIHVDRFGSAITNIRPEALDSPLDRLAATAGGQELGPPARTYAERGEGQPLWLLGSAGYVEVAVNRGSAAQTLGLTVGDTVELAPA